MGGEMPILTWSAAAAELKNPTRSPSAHPAAPDAPGHRGNPLTSFAIPLSQRQCEPTDVAAMTAACKIHCNTEVAERNRESILPRRQLWVPRPHRLHLPAPQRGGLSVEILHARARRPRA